jgi:hypothetical protein
MQYNPYSVHELAHGERFVGRENALNAILYDSKDTIVFGYSRWGKTSALKRAEGLLRTEGAAVLYIGNSGMDQEALFSSICNALRSSNHAAHPLVEGQPNLESALLAINAHYADSERPFHLILDETASLLSNPAFALQSKVWNEQLNSIKFVYAVFPHVFASMQTASSRFQDSAGMVPLVPFCMEETRQLIYLSQDADRMSSLAGVRKPSFIVVKPYRFEEDPTERVFNFTGGLPFLVQGLMSEAISHAQETNEPEYLNTKVFEAACESFPMTIIEQLDHFWNSLTPMQQRMLIRTEKLGSASEDELLEEAMRISSGQRFTPSMFHGALNPLAERGIHLLERQQDRYSIRGTVMKDCINYFGKFTLP